MKAEQVAQRLFNTIRSSVAREHVALQLEIYQILVDELDREMGDLEAQLATDDEKFSGSDDEDMEDEQ